MSTWPGLHGAAPGLAPRRHARRCCHVNHGRLTWREQDRWGGLLTFESDWKPGLGEPLLKALKEDLGDGRLNLGCVAAHGYFSLERNANDHTFHAGGKPATAFLFKLISELQFSGTVPMIDVLAYSRWLTQ
jgi:hypothetical protein